MTDREAQLAETVSDLRYRCAGLEAQLRQQKNSAVAGWYTVAVTYIALAYLML